MSDAHQHLTKFMEALGLDVNDDPHLSETPQRVADLFRDLFGATGTQAPEMSIFDAEDDSAVFMLAQPFRSMCAHHLVPFFGFIDIAYIPAGRIAGFGSFGRVIEWASRKPQLQERMVREIADALDEQLAPAGLIVRARARQMCVELTSGTPGTYVSLAARGALADGPLHQAAIAQCVASEPPL